MYDIAIIGAGPAGSTLARLVAGRYKVLLIDKRPLTGMAPDPWHQKCCGGLLAPDAQKILAQFGLGLPRRVLVDPQIFVVRAIDQTHNLERYYQRFYINLDRYQFDCWLLSMVPSNVAVRLGVRLVAFDATDGGYRIQMQKEGRIFEEKSKAWYGKGCNWAGRLQEKVLSSIGRQLKIKYSPVPMGWRWWVKPPVGSAPARPKVSVMHLEVPATCLKPWITVLPVLTAAMPATPAACGPIFS